MSGLSKEKTNETNLPNKPVVHFKYKNDSHNAKKIVEISPNTWCYKSCCYCDQDCLQDYKARALDYKFDSFQEVWSGKKKQE